MNKEQLIKRKEEVLRLAQEGFEFEEYEAYLPEAENDPQLAMYYRTRDLILDLKDARLAKGYTQKEMAILMGTKQAAISRFERFDNTPSLGFLMKYAQALGVQLVCKPENSILIDLPNESYQDAKNYYRNDMVVLHSDITNVVVNHIRKSATEYERMVATTHSIAIAGIGNYIPSEHACSTESVS